jgi:uncharacterized protein (TIGR00299 family) protein
MRIAYFDCFAGASGNMILGSLLDAGLDPQLFRAELDKLRLGNYEFQIEKVRRKGISGTLVVVATNEPASEHRHLADIETIIQCCDLAQSVKLKSLEIFRRLAQAEANVHAVPIEQIHFHEVGALDAIIDVVGSVAGLTALGIERVYSSPIELGSGVTECDHGIFPVPAPATAELVRGVPVYSSGIQGELLTPTGAAILTTIASNFGAMPEMTVEQIGYGAGTRDVCIPNLLRLIVGETRDSAYGHLQESVVVIETNIDDMNPQIYEYVIERLFEMGALDVFLAGIQMKKSRPGTLLTVICPSNLKDTCADFIMNETTSIGLRWRLEDRIKAHRFLQEHQTLYGPVKFKIAQLGETTINVSAEYEDCRRIAIEKNIPLKHVMQEAGLTATKIKDTLKTQ